jgi:hypothetical protein
MPTTFLKSRILNRDLEVEAHRVDEERKAAVDSVFTPTTRTTEQKAVIVIVFLSQYVARNLISFKTDQSQPKSRQDSDC